MFIKKLGKFGGDGVNHKNGNCNSDGINKTGTTIGLNKDVGNTISNISNLKCFYTNSHSLRNKKDELISYALVEDLDIICITEAWVNESFFGTHCMNMN